MNSGCYILVLFRSGRVMRQAEGRLKVLRAGFSRQDFIVVAVVVFQFSVLRQRRVKNRVYVIELVGFACNFYGESTFWFWILVIKLESWFFLFFIKMLMLRKTGLCYTLRIWQFYRDQVGEYFRECYFYDLNFRLFVLI